MVFIAPQTGPSNGSDWALESWPEIGDCAETERLDALFLHRPWRLELSQIRDGHWHPGLSPAIRRTSYHWLQSSPCRSTGDDTGRDIRP